MKKPKLLVLGASEDQRFLIETAREMGCCVIGVDQNPNAPAFDIVDEKALISTRDTDKLIHFVRQAQETEKIDGVLTMGSEIPVTLAALSEEIGRHSLSKETAFLASNKLAMKKRWAEQNIPIPWFTELESGKHLEQIVAERGWGLVIKPTDRSGARGITILSEGMDCQGVFEKAISFSFEKKVVVEEFLPGLQLSTESIIYDDFFRTAGISDRNYDQTLNLNGVPIENGGTMPTVVNGAMLHKVDSMLEQAGRALGIRQGVAKGDVAFDADGKPRMIEMAARLSGGWMSSGLIPVTSGVNIVKTMIEIALDKTPVLSELTPKFYKHAALRYFFPKAGILKNIENLQIVRDKSWVKVLEFYKEPGENIKPPDSHAERFGAFLIEGDSREQVIGRASWVYETLKIVNE